MTTRPKLTGENLLREFQTILALEEEAAQAYLQLAEDCDDPQSSQMLRQIAKEELAHVAIAAELVRLAREWTTSFKERDCP